MKIDKLICCSNKYAMLHFFYIATNWVSGRVGAMAEIRPSAMAICAGHFLGPLRIIDVNMCTTMGSVEK